MSTQLTLCLLALKPGIGLPDFAVVLHQSNLKPYLQGKVSGWAVAPTHLSIDDLAKEPIWDVMLLLESDNRFPQAILDVVASSWHMDVLLSSEIVAGLSETNHKLLFPDQEAVPKLTSEWLQGPWPPASCITVTTSAASIGELPITAERAEWMRAHGERPEGGDAVTMLNLMAYVPETGKTKMARYAGAFQPAFGVKYGTAVKIFGSVGSYSSRESDVRNKGYAWEDCAMVHYPSIWHFGEMLSSAEYTDLERKHKVNAMRDTCILCISETGLVRA